jgi:hypothetical protein
MLATGAPAPAALNRLVWVWSTHGSAASLRVPGMTASMALFPG